MFIVGLTGGIGSGKSAVADKFKELGVPCIDADQVSREVVKTDSPALYAIHKKFGEDILLSNGTLNRARLREIIFSDPSSKVWLEQRLHPVINNYITEQLTQLAGAYGLLVSPLLFETRQDELTHYTIAIDTPEDLQISRTLQRDNVPEQQVREIILSQISREERLARADAVIDNSGSLEDLYQQVIALHQQLLQKAREI